MKLSAAVDDYAKRGRYRGGTNRNVPHTQTTFYGYKNRLEQFMRWCQETGHGDPEVSEITWDLLDEYYYHVVNQGVRPRTVASHVHALRFLFGYLAWRKVIRDDPSAQLKVPKLDAAERKLISDNDLERLWEAALKQADDFKAIRDRAVLSVLIFTAIRRQELLDLQVEDIDLDQDLLLVRSGKGNKSRSIPLCQEAHADLEAWLNVRRRLPAKHAKLFCVDTCRPLGESGLAALIKDVAAIAGLKEGDLVKPHTLRHAAATRFLNNGATLKDCQVLLGHSDLRVTSIYLHANEQSIRPMASLLGFQRQPTSEEQPLKPESPRRRSPYQRRRSLR